MGTTRGLLTLGNAKVGQAVHLWGLPAVETCPGSTGACRAACYATKGRFRFENVKARLRWNLEQALTPDFAPRMAREVRGRGCLVVRVHVSGDYFDAEYAEKWLFVMKRCAARFYWYTRSFAVPEVATVLAKMAARSNVRGWYSVDRDTPPLGSVPDGVRVAYLQTRPAEPLPGADLLFRVRGLRRERVPLSLACPSESPGGRGAGLTCGACGRCFN